MIDDIKKILNDYKPNYDIMCEDSELITKLKQAVCNLSDADRIIFVLYCETGSLRQTAKMLGVSHTTIYKLIRNLKKQILDDIGYNADSNNSLLCD